MSSLKDKMKPAKATAQKASVSESFASGISLFREPYPRQDRHRDVVSVNFRTDLPQTPTWLRISISDRSIFVSE